MTAKIIWTLIFFCSIRGVYANAAKKEIAYTSIYSYAVFLHVHAGRSFWSTAAGLYRTIILNKNRIIKTKGLFLNEIVLFSI